MALTETQIADLITAKRLKSFAPSIKPSISASIIRDCPKIFSDNAIHTEMRIAHFFAQVLKETGGLDRLDEDLRYTTIKRLRQMFSRFKGLSDAEVKPYLKAPERLANFVYSGRNGNGDIASGDGWTYRGSGLIQLTGRGNYRSAAKETGLDLEGKPELARSEDSCVAVAVAFWTVRKINNVIKDSGAGVDAVTKRVNPGEDAAGRKERRDNYTRARKIFV